ncbi:heparinase II/III domain-containing protein [Clostridium grantii]|uniref:Heparinase II/III-like protein n=1 Tax=Clostridium grantii DSM 8605 TaxID=1121316 RepID=A0A1M5UVV7_9CLOT|nr:heparinase II/III family protein [Clostridium grantii]SHH67074.1 Heparinase II/III-like protein [Clostridium grantii DSM 8605]
MNYFSDLNLVKELDKDKKIYHDMLNEMDKEVTSFAESFKDDSSKMSEWGHNYFCEEDGGRLIFDLEKPHSHVCEICGREFKGQMFDNVWVYFYRNTAIITLVKAATLYKVRGDERYLAYIKNILSFYADHYSEFVIHAKNKVIDDLTYDVGGAAKIMPQALNEAIILVRIISALEMVKNEIGKEYLDEINKKLFIPATNLLTPQLIRIHNIPCWINSALGIVALFTDNKELLDKVFNSEFGVRNQLKEGVTDEGFWYEGSVHYNFFLLEGVTNLLLFTKLYDYDFGEEEAIIRKMFKSAFYYAFDNDILPNPNDGWPNVNLKTYSYIYHVATKIFGENSEVGNFLKNIEKGSLDRATIPLSRPYYYQNEIPLERLTFNPELDFSTMEVINRESNNFASSYYGTLRNDKINVFYKYGHRGPSHAHPDKMNIEVMLGESILTRDLSNAGYASRLCNEWHRMSASHNTVVVDGKNHVSTEGGIILKFTEESLHAKVEDVYEKVDYERKIDLLPSGFNDEFIVSSSEQHTYDWFFHSEAKLLSELSYESASLEFNENGYQHISNVRKVVTDSTIISLEWELDGKIIESKIDITDKEMFICDTFDNPVSSLRTSIILREKNNKATFKVNWTLV